MCSLGLLSLDGSWCCVVGFPRCLGLFESFGVRRGTDAVRKPRSLKSQCRSPLRSCFFLRLFHIRMSYAHIQEVQAELEWFNGLLIRIASGLGLAAL